ncbi:ATP-binding cassette domain-containing protein [Sphingomonas sp.]|uniref:ABC transporter ATP-binding protein n=1 Tax=Sphingomonas sp. TaxID=28214 RepID=UPI001B0E12CB|nr:ATP-binding cassette domain-containing protein [Sphingomonas sp.]MBO9713733.1 ATP-binding cassette domain-containing protein [Sphingomonas sp.]
MNAPVLLLDDVTKRFGDFTAVDALSFAVPEGGVFGFLGGNGAGKTTSLRMTLDIVRPTSGRIEVLGAAPSREHAAQIGFLPEERGLYRGMSVLDTVIYFARLKGMDAASARKAATALLERLDLADRLKTRIGKLSKGLAQKVQLATAIVNTPRLVLLDEPFSGLDPVNQGVLEDVIKDLARGGSTVIFSTHVMQHAERLCDRLLLLARGKKVFEGTQDEARGALPSRLTLTSRGDPAALPGVASATPTGAAADGWTNYQLALAPGASPGDLLEACTGQGFALRSFDIHRPTLHEVFIHLVGGDQEIVK